MFIISIYTLFESKSDKRSTKSFANLYLADNKIHPTRQAVIIIKFRF